MSLQVSSICYYVWAMGLYGLIVFLVTMTLLRLTLLMLETEYFGLYDQYHSC